MVDVTTLISDTLYGRRMERSGCISTNAAGHELALSREDALPKIEAVIDSIVIPALESAAHHQEEAALLAAVPPRLRGKVQLAGDFAGLDFLLGAYLAIGVRFSNPRVFAYLERCPPRILEEALTGIRIFFRAEEDVFAEDQVVPNLELQSFVERLAQFDDPKVRDAARYVLRLINEDIDKSRRVQK